MKKINKIIFFANGLFLMLVAVPVFAQEVKDVEINKRPFQDLAASVKQQVEAKKVDLTKPFSVELKGVLTKDGRLDQRTAKFTKTEGDTAMVEVGKQFIEAVSDCGLFAYLKNLGIEQINFALVQNDKQIYANIVSETPTPDKARTIVSALNFMTQIVQMKNDEMKNISADDKIIINGLKASSEGKTLTLNFAYEKSVIQEMINRKLQEAK